MKTIEIDNILEIDESREKIKMLNDWLPKKIIDSHLHCWRNETSTCLLNNQAKVPGAMFNCFDWEFHDYVLKQFFPKIKYSIVAIGLPFVIKDCEANRYLSNLSLNVNNVFPVLLCTDEGDECNLDNSLKKIFCALKMYPNFEQKSKVSTEIRDVFPENTLEIVNHNSSAIILHLPSNIFENVNELISLAKRYKKVSFIVAHMGNVYLYRDGLKTIFEKMSKCNNIFLDTAMVADEQVIAEGIVSLGDNRILFGSDAPISYIRGKHKNDIHGRLILQSKTRFSWVYPHHFCDYSGEVKNFEIFYLEIISSIWRAIELLGVKNQEGVKRNIFYRNSKKLFRR